MADFRMRKPCARQQGQFNFEADFRHWGLQLSRPMWFRCLGASGWGLRPRQLDSEQTGPRLTQPTIRMPTQLRIRGTANLASQMRSWIDLEPIVPANPRSELEGEDNTLVLLKAVTELQRVWRGAGSLRFAWEVSGTSNAGPMRQSRG